MHIPEQMINGAVCPVTAGIAVTGLALAAYAAVKSKKKPSLSFFASVAAFIFAAQMLNFPIGGGTSGHYLGAAFAAIALGTPFGILAMALIVTVQAVVFSDGGMTVLGANIVNMSIVGAGLPGILYAAFFSKNENAFSRMSGVFIVSFLSVIAAASLCSLELSISTAASAGDVFGAMMKPHSLIALAEASATMIFAAVFAGRKIQANSRAWNKSFIVFAAFIMALVIAPFASSFPDGLESAAGNLGILKESAPLFVTPLSDYTLSGSENFWAVSLAGAFGIVVVMVSVLFLGTLFQRTANAVLKK
ncbi:MAG TPA: energy-coupling factor ABC transporter permease [Spirochaetota bacterium]|nr:energy-coupling factor ABC transporter permease [Spirochaetota bacterium]